MTEFLTGWKEIAAYLRVSVRTVQRQLERLLRELAKTEMAASALPCAHKVGLHSQPTATCGPKTKPASVAV